MVQVCAPWNVLQNVLAKSHCNQECAVDLAYFCLAGRWHVLLVTDLASTLCWVDSTASASIIVICTVELFWLLKLKGSSLPKRFSVEIRQKRESERSKTSSKDKHEPLDKILAFILMPLTIVICWALVGLEPCKEKILSSLIHGIEKSMKHEKKCLGLGPIFAD